MNLEQLRKHKPQILAIAEKYGVSNIRVFGSVARGDADAGSDVDLLVKWEKPTFDNYYYFKQEMRTLLQCEVDTVEENYIRNPLRKAHILKDATCL